jgi:protein TonB
VKSLSTLQIALGVSVAVHAALLTVRIVDPEASTACSRTRRWRWCWSTPSNEKVDKAQAIAQASLAGGGEAEKGRATSPLPPSALMQIGDAAEDAQRKIDVDAGAADADAGADQAARWPPCRRRPEAARQQARRRASARKSAAT